MEKIINYKNEVKDGYLVPSILKRSWYAQIEVLKYVDEICRENNIRYFADCGTLLGAIRHRGFIPWDDDIDLAMLRSDYIRFRDIVLEKDDEYFKLKCFKSREGFTDFKILLTNDNKIDFSKERLKIFCGFPFATGIDIFPYDYLPSSDEEKDQLYKDIVFALTVKDKFEKDQKKQEQMQMLSQLEEKFNFHIDRERNIIHQINLAIEKRMSQYQEEESTLVTHIPDWIKNRKTEYSKTIFDNSVYMQFENISIPVSWKYEEQLRVQYGEYIEMVKGFAGHEFPYYIEQIGEANNMGISREELRLFEYNEDLLEREQCSEKKKVDKQRYIDNIKLQVKILNLIIKLVSQGEIENALDMLQSLQESAMRLGNTIELSTITTRAEVVSNLEKYCEYIYETYQILTKEISGDIASALRRIADELDIIARIIDEGNIEEKKRIAILFSHKKEWDVLENIYSDLIKSEETIVYPILLPYYDYTNNYEPGDYHFEVDELSEELKIYDYESIDFENEYFDEIYYSNAFEKYDWGELTLQAFYSRNLQKISPKIIFVQSFIIDDFEKDNVPMMYSAREYICTPGVVQADEIWVQSDKMGNHFEDILTEVSGEQNRKHWHSKIKKIPFEITANRKNDINPNNQILVYINLSQLTILKEEKLAQINNIIKDMKGYTIYLCWDRAIDEYMINYDEETYSLFCEFVKKNIACGLIKALDSEEIEIAEYAAYAGDRSWLTNIFVSEGKKVYLFDI